MKQLIYILACCCSVMVTAQRTYIYGFVKDSARMELSDVAVRNLNAGLISTSGEDGSFRIPAQKGDTLSLTHIGYEPYFVAVDEPWKSGESMVFRLEPNTTYLDEITITRFPEYQQFKEQLLSTSAEDTSLQVFGVPKVVIRPEDRINASLAIRGPFSAIHNTFSKRAKEQKKLRTMLHTQGARDKARQKFTREWVGQMTRLEGDQLTSFIAYCNFSEAYLASTPEYLIHEDMMELLPKFLQELDQKG